MSEDELQEEMREQGFIRHRMIDAIFSGQPIDLQIGHHLYHIKPNGTITAEIVDHLPPEGDFDPPIGK